jgi:hypothetical protein
MRAIADPGCNGRSDVGLEAVAPHKAGAGQAVRVDVGFAVAAGALLVVAGRSIAQSAGASCATLSTSPRSTSRHAARCAGRGSGRLSVHQPDPDAGRARQLFIEHLDDGRALMLFRLHDRRGAAAKVRGRLIGARGKVEQLAPGRHRCSRCAGGALRTAAPAIRSTDAAPRPTSTSNLNCVRACTTRNSTHGFATGKAARW